MGSVPQLYRNKRGGFWFNAYIGGKQKRFTVPGPGKREALKQQLELLKEAKEDKPQSKLTLAQWMDHWFAVQSFKSYSTKRNYAREVMRINKNLGHISLVELSPRHIREFYVDLQETLAPATRKLTHAVLRLSLQMAEDDEEIIKSPLRKIKNPGGPSPEAECFTKEEVRKILEVSESSPYYISILLGIYAGLRVGEACGLRWSDVNLETHHLHVRKAMKRSEDGLEHGTPKTKSGVRQFTISETLVRALCHQRDEQMRLRFFLGKNYKSEDLVMTQPDGTRCHPHTVSRAFTRILQREQIRVLPFHSLRHTHLTWCMQNREDLKNVSQRAGHSKVAFTSQVYGHVTAEMDEGLAMRFDQILNEAL